VNPGQLVGVREIGTTDVLPSDIDTAVFSGPRANYTIIANADGSVTVTDVSAAAVDGVDTLWNIEQLSFCNTPGAVRGTCAVARTIVRIAPTVTVTPTSLTFANQFINTTSAVQAIIVSNTGFTRLTVSGITVTGADAASFTTTNSCTNVAPGGSCTISVRFAPTSVGAKTAAISIASNDPTSPKVVPVIGTAINTVIGLNPNPLAFGSQLVGTNSATQAIVVRNTSTARITINALVLGGPNSNQFTILNPGGCPGNLNANATCTINVQFRPTAASGAGNKTATITITSPTGGTAVATVTGTATTQATIGALANVAFGNRPTGSTTTTTLQVTNTGSAPLNISSVSLTGSTTFSASLGTCSAAVAPGASCQLVVSFVPTTNNNVTALLTIISNASNNPRTVTLTGR
jgi:hypothetical protein